MPLEEGMGEIVTIIPFGGRMGEDVGVVTLERAGSGSLYSN